MSSRRSQPGELPEAVSRLFWGVDPGSVDLVRHRDYVVERVMARGGWQAMRWLRDAYTTPELRDVLQRKAHLLPPRERAYWALITGLELPGGVGGGTPTWTRR